MSRTRGIRFWRPPFPLADQILEVADPTIYECLKAECAVARVRMLVGGEVVLFPTRESERMSKPCLGQVCIRYDLFMQQCAVPTAPAASIPFFDCRTSMLMLDEPDHRQLRFSYVERNRP